MSAGERKGFEMKIANCPFCGSDKVGLHYSRDDTYWVECYDCEASGPTSIHDDDAVEKWQIPLPGRK